MKERGKKDTFNSSFYMNNRVHESVFVYKELLIKKKNRNKPQFFKNKLLLHNFFYYTTLKRIM